jgi:c-di-GMP-related signal transduction protein
MPEQPGQELFLGRQPILDRQQNLAAFEVLFRSGHFNGAQVEDDVFASATVINRVFSELGVEAVLGKHLGFINLSTPLLMSEVVTLLPPNKVVLEILETVRVSDALVERCKQLKRMGFTLALDDFTGREAEFAALLGVVDIVKVDVQHMDERALLATTASLKTLGVRLLAEKLDSRRQVDHCIELGYELFQGYYFARPTIITGRRLSSAEEALMRLLELVLGNADTPAIEAVFQANPALEAQLLKLLNSGARSGAEGIRSLRDAIVVLGRRQVQRWLHVLLYTLGSAPEAAFPSPLLVLAATRGKLMELIAQTLRAADRRFRDFAFTTGALSLVNALLGMPMGEILHRMPADSEVRAALIERSGELGAILLLVEALEEADVSGIEAALGRVPALEHGQVIDLQVEAIRWADSFGEPR